MKPRLSRCLCALILVVNGGAATQPPGKLVVAQSHEQVQDCLREIWGKPVFWDQAVVARVDASVCKAKPEDVEAELKAQHLVAFRLSNGVLLTTEFGFRQQGHFPYYHWKLPNINIRVLPRVTPGSRPPTEAELHDFADTILKRSHLAPVTYPFEASEGQIGRLAFNIFIEIHKMHPGSQQESVVALLTDSDADHETVLGAGRFVYGELQDGHLQFRWESPLLETSMFQDGFVDLLGNGRLQIILTSIFGMRNHTGFYAFDLDGRGLSRQSSTCETFSERGAHSAAACPISTESDIEIKDNAGGPRALLATNEAGKKVRYVFNGVRYEEVSGSRATNLPLVPRATALNNRPFSRRKARQAAWRGCF
jgi:hypothetical protein